MRAAQFFLVLALLVAPATTFGQKAKNKVWPSQMAPKPTPFNSPKVYTPAGQNLYPITPGVGIDCTSVDRRMIARPRVDVYHVERSGTRYRIEGTVEGVCLTEAGYFQNGVKLASIGVTTIPTLTRQSFSFLADANEMAEVRVYNVTGDRDTFRVRPSDVRPQSGSSAGRPIVVPPIKTR